MSGSFERIAIALPAGCAPELLPVPVAALEAGEVRAKLLARE